MSWVAVAVTTAVAAGGYTAYSQYQQGAAQQRFSNYQSAQEKLNAQAALNVAAKQSELVQDQQEFSGQDQAFNAARLVAAQRTTEAADGIASNSVTAEDIAKDSFVKQRKDESMLKYNADLKSWSIETQGNEEAFQHTQQGTLDTYAGKAAKVAGQVAATGTLLSTAATVAGIGARASSGSNAPKTPSTAGVNQ